MSGRRQRGDQPRAPATAASAGATWNSTYNAALDWLFVPSGPPVADTVGNDTSWSTIAVTATSNPDANQRRAGSRPPRLRVPSTTSANAPASGAMAKKAIAIPLGGSTWLSTARMNVAQAAAVARRMR